MLIENILITGAGGQIGTVLTAALRQRYPTIQVIASDIRPIPHEADSIILDITDRDAMENIVRDYQITQIYHLAAILSATGEKNPLRSWDINMQGLINVLEVSRLNQVKKVFYPSSIAVFGPGIPRDNTPQDTVLVPETVYGISKAVGENWCNYYFKKYGLDVRSIRYPGIISYQSDPGGGTTDYAVEIYHKAVNQKDYQCYLSEDTSLPMIYMDDAIRATLDIMAAPIELIRTRTSYNISAISFSPKEIAESIAAYYPDFTVTYVPDFRQAIADSWPKSIDDFAARRDWGWEHTYNLDLMTKEMITQLRLKQSNKLHQPSK